MTETLLLLGFDTVSTALSWSVMYMVAYPEIQERLYQELSKHRKLTWQTSPHSSRENNTWLLNWMHRNRFQMMCKCCYFHPPPKHCSHPFALSLQRETWIWIAHHVSLINKIFHFWRPSSWKPFVIVLSFPSPSLIGTAHLFRDAERSRYTPLQFPGDMSE